MSRTIRIALDGATGRLGGQQHLARSLLAIRDAGGLVMKNGERLVPQPVLLGRNPEKLAAVAAAHGGLEWSTDTDECLADPAVEIYFDAAATAGRAERAARAIAAGKHVYLEKPVAGSVEDALGLWRAARAAGVKHGVVQDKLFLPGLLKLRRLRDSGFFGKILAVRLEFGWWVFDGSFAPAQRTSWNYRKSTGGGLVLDMCPHWRYIIDRLVGDIRAVSCRTATHVPQRRDADGSLFDVDVEDAFCATFELEGGVLAVVNCSWATRVRRDDMLTIQVDGTAGSAVAGLQRCFIQPLVATPKPVWSIDGQGPEDFAAQWQEVPDITPFKNSYRAGWELFLLHVADGGAFAFDLGEAVKGVQLAEACTQSARERRWIDVPPIDGAEAGLS